MEDLIFLVVLFIALIVTITMILYIRLEKKRNEKIHTNLNEVLCGLNTISGSINSNEKSAVYREDSLRSLISMNEQKLENVINQIAKNNEGRIGYMEDRIVNEIQSSSIVIQSANQRIHSELSNSFKSKLSDIGAELNELHQNLREFKDDILRTQAQSFSGLETRIGVIRNEEHRFIEHELQVVNREQTNIGKCVQGVTTSMNNHFASLKPLEELLGQLNKLYNNLISLDKDILCQEISLNAMVEKHTKILEYTQELQKTSEEIFDMMKLLVMDSVVKQTTPNNK